MYALEYLRHKLVFQTNLRLMDRLSLNASLRWQDRVGNFEQNSVTVPYDPYTLLDARLQWDERRYSIYVEAENILNKEYYDHGNIPQPGIIVRGGLSIKF